MCWYPLIKEGQRSHKYAFYRANGAIKMENVLVPPFTILLDTIDLVKSCHSEGTWENEIQGIMEDFDYHESMNAENYEKHFEKVCSLLKPNSLIVIDNASYYSQNSEDYPISKWRKAKFQKWLSENNISFSPDALRYELWILCNRHRVEKTSKIVEEIAKKYGHEVLRLPPYHCELNAIELIWGDEKNYVARENKSMTIEGVEKLFIKRRGEINKEICWNCIQHVRSVEDKYWEMDRIIDQKMDKLMFSVGDSDDESDISVGDSDDESDIEVFSSDEAN